MLSSDKFLHSGNKAKDLFGIYRNLNKVSRSKSHRFVLCDSIAKELQLTIGSLCIMRIANRKSRG